MDKYSNFLNADEATLNRFWKKIDKQGPMHPTLKTRCWVWKAYIDDKGYGIFSFQGKAGYAHRFSYILDNGEFLESLTIDHICKVRSCVNPGHLRLLTLEENARDGVKWNRLKTTCPKGHPFNRFYKGERICTICYNEYSRNWKRQKRAKVAL